MQRYFDTAPAAEVDSVTHVEKGHAHGSSPWAEGPRLETRRHLVSAKVDWMSGSRHYPGEPRFPNLRTIGMVESTVEKPGHTSTERRFYISSAALGAERFAGGVRGHWGIENQLHWVLDVQFKEDQSRLRIGHGAKNMAVVRHFAINLVRGAGDKRSIKTRRKLAGWDTDYLHSLINPSPS